MTGDDGKPPRKPAVGASVPKPLPKRFYAQVTAGPDTGQGAALLLDGKNARTPGKRELRLPTLALARAVAGEWAAQSDRIDPARMPLTRLANTAIDGVAGREDEVRADVVKFAASDLVCYRAERPEGLIQHQSELWDPVLAWAATSLGARFIPATGILHQKQPEDSLAAIATCVAPLDAYRLTALHNAMTLTGSSLLALGVLKSAWTAEHAWKAAHVDEDWQIAQWGSDAEAAVRRERRWVEMAAAARLMSLIG